MLQKANRRAAAEKTVRKIEAEAIAFVVAQTIGLSTGRALRREVGGAPTSAPESSSMDALVPAGI